MAGQVEERITPFKERIETSHAVWMEINLNHVRKNIQTLRDYVGYGTGIIAVVKADGYGHGAVQVSKVMAEEGVGAFAVASIEEAIDLRVAGIDSDLLVMSSVDLNHLDHFIDFDLTPSIFSLSFAQKLQQLAERRGVQLNVQIRVDMAGSSFGVYPHAALTLVEQVLGMSHLHVQGVYTHLVSAYSADEEVVEEEIGQFSKLISEIKQRTKMQVIHAASSPATIRYPSSHFTSIRPGTSLYGLPSFAEQDLDIVPVMQLKARVQDIKATPSGVIRGYRHEIESDSTQRVAMVPVGYAQAPYLFFQKKGYVLINGEKAAMLGQSNMSHLMVDITGIEQVKIGDEVVLIGEQGEESITAAEVAQRSGIGIINCDSVCLLGQSVPRVYVE